MSADVRSGSLHLKGGSCARGEENAVTSSGGSSFWRACVAMEFEKSDREIEVRESRSNLLREVGKRNPLK
jgi:hypothetical protein